MKGLLGREVINLVFEYAEKTGTDGTVLPRGKITGRGSVTRAYPNTASPNPEKRPFWPRQRHGRHLHLERRKQAFALLAEIYNSDLTLPSRLLLRIHV